MSFLTSVTSKLTLFSRRNYGMVAPGDIYLLEHGEDSLKAVLLHQEPAKWSPGSVFDGENIVFPLPAADKKTQKIPTLFKETGDHFFACPCNLQTRVRKIY